MGFSLSLLLRAQVDCVRQLHYWPVVMSGSVVPVILAILLSQNR